jgi:hypothetical protein
MPPLISEQCMSWMQELDKSIPSVVLSVSDADAHERFDALVTIDGSETGPLRATSILLDPGEHTFRCVLPGEAPLEMRRVILEGEHDQLVRFEYPRRAPRRMPLQPLATNAPRPLPWYVVVLGSTALVATGVWAYFGVSGLWGDPSALTLSHCSPYCSPSDHQAVHDKLIIADVAGIAALAAVAATVILYATRPTHRVAAKSLQGSSSE